MHVESAAITDISYDEQAEKLFVRLDSGEQLMYVGVPPTVHRSFAEADSKHRFFEQEIHDCYPYNRLPA
jgi:hypothetical protein